MIAKQKGTIDIYGLDAKKWQYVTKLIEDLCQSYNYGWVRTPVFEATELFHRGVGETTDIVTKETYDFQDRGDRNITLRPEGTAGVVRSYIENKMYGDATQPIKLFYIEPMYRYERPQSGRLREFSQFGCEVIGSDDALIDAEVISIPVNLFKTLGLRNVRVNINTLGDRESRENYRTNLINYFKPHIDELCEDCKVRLEKNPLRILDCKVDAESKLIKEAPKTIDYLNEESKKRFEAVKHYLEVMDIDYVVNPKIVRGLDYYNHTVFEIMADIDDMGSQSTLAAGGRYNGMIESLGGPATPAIGFACGLDRLMLALEKEDIELPIKNWIDAYIMYVSDTEKDYAASICQNLRLSGFDIEMENMQRSLKAQFKQADRLNSKFLIILNNEDIKNKVIKIKDNVTKEEVSINEEELIDYLNMNM